MKTFIGVKIIDAEPMTEHGFLNKVKNQDVPKNQENREGYKVVYPDGYVSWSPKGAFEEAYREVGEGVMTFGLAVEAMKKGKRVSREGWNGKDMYAVLMPGYPDGIVVNEERWKAHGLPEGSILRFRPYYQLYTAQGDIAVWAPSGSDTLAEDWFIVQ